MYKRIVLFFICLGFACGAFAQEIDTTQVEAPAEVPVISYSLAPKKYKIADIKITGIKNYDDFVLIGFSGLSVGDEITVPGEEITTAVKRFWKHGYEDRGRPDLAGDPAEAASAYLASQLPRDQERRA